MGTHRRGQVPTSFGLQAAHQQRHTQPASIPAAHDQPEFIPSLALQRKEGEDKKDLRDMRGNISRKYEVIGTVREASALAGEGGGNM